MFQLTRILKYRVLSDCMVVGRHRVLQPVQMVGKGLIRFHGSVTIGYFPSPLFLCGYCYLEARNKGATVEIGNGTWVNNNFVAISEHKSIRIGENVRIGTSVEVYDSDFHSVDPDRRGTSSLEDASEVTIGDNVFIGSNARILKGVSIGQDSVIANGSIVTKSVPSGVVAGGNPARVLRQLYSPR